MLRGPPPEEARQITAERRIRFSSDDKIQERCIVKVHCCWNEAPKKHTGDEIIRARPLRLVARL
jgi:hypothetical protein